MNPNTAIQERYKNNRRSSTLGMFVLAMVCVLGQPELGYSANASVSDSDEALANELNGVRHRFDELFARAQRDEARAMFEINQLVFTDCAHVADYASVEQYKEAAVQSGRMHSVYSAAEHIIADFEKRVNNFDDCVYVLSHAPDGMLWYEWTQALLIDAAFAGDLVAGMQVSEYYGALTVFVDLFPEVLNEQNIYPRMKVFNTLANAQGDANTSDSLFFHSWALAWCATDPQCSLPQFMAEVEQSATSHSPQQIMESYVALEQKLQSNQPLSRWLAAYQSMPQTRIFAAALQPRCQDLPVPVSPDLCDFAPIMLDTDGDGFDFEGTTVTVWFDLDADGQDDHIRWVNPGGGEEFLALDRNGNGLVDDGSELFRSGISLAQRDNKARNGYQLLAEYDQSALGGNEDNSITSADQIWDRLLLWNDQNADGISTDNEVTRLKRRGYTGMTAVPLSIDPNIDGATYPTPFWGYARKQDGTAHTTASPVLGPAG